jgi:protein-disulfide isomerase
MENNNKSSLPVALIGIVLLVALGGGWWYYNKTKTPEPSPNKTPAPTQDWNAIFAKARPGASPAWSKGSPTAAVTVEEFADFQCPTCGYMHPKVQEMRAAFGDRVRIVFRQFPLTQAHPHAYDAACAAEAAGAQGKFWEMQNLLFSNQQTWSNSSNPRQIFTDYAKSLSLDVNRFTDDMLSLAVKNRVDADMNRGKDVNVGSTPSFYINNKPLGTSLDSLQSEVEKELQRVEGAKQAETAPKTSTNSNAAPTNK